ncbi:hypothetical protein KR032_008508 [Drosophila birchii]|nr:hypothetical protein KR032_008508 [Drosophila birchii]
MSLFPAYGGGKPSPPAAAAGSEATKEAGTSAAWKSNKSYEKEAEANLGTAVAEQSHLRDEDESSCSSSSSDEVETPPPPPPPKKVLHQQRLEFDAKSDGFYVDKKCNNSLRTVSTLTKPTRPRYKRRLRHLFDARQASEPLWRRSKLQRYTKQAPEPPSSLLESKHPPEEVAKLQAQLMDTKVLVQREPQRLEHWLQLHRLLELNLDRANRLAVSEHQLHTLETALGHHPSNEQLLRLYTETAGAAYPASEVAVRLAAMLQRSPFVYTLWSSLIMATQGTMARCNVPDVLRIYEDSMRRMHLGHTDTSSHLLDTVDTDKIMLDLFHNCVLFLRQSANNNHVFALLRLALELNFPGLAVDCLEARADDERPLIEFEELVLQSGMPLPEIWTRVERLRQAYNFLPYPQLSHSSEDAVEGGLDPQRCIFTDDVCHYIYPLKTPGNRLQLLLLVVQLTKMPLVRSDCLAERLSTRIDQLGDSEAIEMLLAGLADRSSYALHPADHDDFTAAMLDLVREMCVTPSFMPHCIGSDLYAATISNLLLKCSEAFQAEETKRRLFVILWLRFQRLLLALHKLMGKLTAEYLKESRARIRNLMRLEQNRHVSRFYTELAMCEFEVLERDDDPSRAFNIFRTVIAMQEEAEDDESITCPDVMHAYLIYAEMLISRNRHDQALQLLRCICLGRTTKQTSPSLDEDTSLQQLKVEIQGLDGMPAEMPLEDYFLSNKLLILLRARCFVWSLENRSLESDALLAQLLKNQLSFAATKTSERRRFLREQVLELQLVLRQLPLPEKPLAEQSPLKLVALGGNKHLVDLVELGLHEFPRNLVFLQRWATFSTLQWHKLRARFIRTQAGILSLLHLVIAARCRLARILEQTPSYDQQPSHLQLRSHLEAAVRNRVLNMFETFLPRNTNRSEIEANQYHILRRNSLYWRSYLRCLSDTRTSFERSKECLVSALDECPWDKALYMDGAIYVPQELAHLQDVMTEKQLRIYALPEELNILRGS